MAETGREPHEPRLPPLRPVPESEDLRKAKESIAAAQVHIDALDRRVAYLRRRMRRW